MYKSIHLNLLMVIAFSIVAIAQAGAAQGAPVQATIGGNNSAITPTGLIKLFDGNSLDGLYSWLQTTGYDDPTNVFQVKDNLLHVSGNGLGYIASHDRYRDFHMILEFKWGTNTYKPRAARARDGGLLIHGNGKDGGGQQGKAMSALQSQMIEGGMGDLIIVQGVDNNGDLLPQSMTVETEWVTCLQDNWGCWYGYLYGYPATHRWKDGGDSVTFTDWDLIHTGYWDPNWQDYKGYRGANNLENPNGAWNQMVVIADGDTVQVYFNGVKVNEATKVFPTSGRVHVQSEWAELFVRRWELWPVGQAPSPINPATSGGGGTTPAPPSAPTNLSIMVR